jgi:hypothetical protein
MKKTLLSLLFVPILSFAQIEAQKPVACFPMDYLQKELKKGEETPLLISKNKMTNESTIIVFKNEKNGTWTIIEFKDDFGCVLGFGVDKTGKSI